VLRELAESCRALFLWEDGPLVTAMKRGELLLTRTRTFLPTL
jgi:midasin (ATPase involved in ribosome maturation)